VTDAGRLYLDKDFTGFWAIQVQLDDFKGRFCFECDSGGRFHLSHLPQEPGCSACFEFLSPSELPSSSISHAGLNLIFGNPDEHPSLCPEHCTLAANVKTGDSKPRVF
jgi:hypothetical protein